MTKTAAGVLKSAEIDAEARRICEREGEDPDATVLTGRPRWMDHWFEAARALRYYERGVED